MLLYLLQASYNSRSLSRFLQHPPLLNRGHVANVSPHQTGTWLLSITSKGGQLVVNLRARMSPSTMADPTGTLHTHIHIHIHIHTHTHIYIYTYILPSLGDF